jgi:hypothetical protein
VREEEIVPEVGDDKWTLAVRERERGTGRVPIWDFARWAVGLFQGWAETVPCGLFLIFFISFPFLFTNFWFYSNLLQIWFKPI